MDTVKQVFSEGEWLMAQDVHAMQINPPADRSLPASDWKQNRLIYSVTLEGKEYYPRYQFDAQGQPLPVIKAILAAYGEYADPWAVAAWFHFPNGWIASETGNQAVPVSPKDALSRVAVVVEAARKRRGTYVA